MKMSCNVGRKDRVLRGVGALALLSCAVSAPLPLFVRLAAFGAAGVYLLFTSLVGTCFGYWLLRKSSSE